MVAVSLMIMLESLAWLHAFEASIRDMFTCVDFEVR